jgi:nitrate/TMAO reductase-like tetraheme cytochrome c subunit
MTKLGERTGEWLRPVLHLGGNGTTLTGAVLTTSSAVTLAGFWAFETFGSGRVHPYAGILFFLILPAFFVLGLLLIPLGILIRRRRLKKQGQLPHVYPKLDLHQPGVRRGLILVAAATVLNVAILGTASYRGIEYMDSTQFCGLTCHSVMAPEHTAYVDSPHARVSCVECHIGPGAPWFVRSKLSGVRQVFAVAFETYSRPIPSPVKELRPARETCEQCHWPQKFHGDKFLVRTRYQEDETNTPLTTVLILKVGGRSWQGATGIHGRHLDSVERVEYVSTDGRRQVIPRVTYLDDQGKTVEYVSKEIAATPQQLAAGERRKMDCMDCHNRPTHAFEMPDSALDKAISEGRISPDLPFVKKKALELLKAEYPDRTVAAERIVSGLREYYRTTHPETYTRHRDRVEGAAEQVRAIYQRNVFPEMKVFWGTYPNNIGHRDFPGCFRCHDGNHVSHDGKELSQDCESCHTILANEEADPKVLKDLGLK